MYQTATITSKRQLTLPVKLFQRAKLKEGQKVAVRYADGELVIRPMNKVIKELAGSVKIPRKYSTQSIDTIIAHSKKEYFCKRKV